MKYFIETYGCQMNEYDSELVANILGDLGYSKSNKIENADAIFLNTCAIREKAEDTVHNRLDSLAYQYYGTTTLWWVISQANHLGGDTMYAPVGQKIRIPHHIEEIMRDMDYLNSRR